MNLVRIRHQLALKYGTVLLMRTKFNFLMHRSEIAFISKKKELVFMADVIWGNVTNILDGNTFKINITHRDSGNKGEYVDSERIRIKEIVPEIPNNPEDRSKNVLERNLVGKFIRCDVQQRDDNGYLVSKVSLSGIGGY